MISENLQWDFVDEIVLSFFMEANSLWYRIIVSKYDPHHFEGFSLFFFWVGGLRVLVKTPRGFFFHNTFIPTL